MRLAAFSDLSFRVLLYAAAHDDRLVTIEEIHTNLKVSRGHLMKVVHKLTTAGVLRSVRGRAGGITLNKPKREISLASVIRSGETDFAQVECMRADGGTCTFTGFCKLPGPLNEAMDAYLGVLEKYTLEDIEVSSRIASLA
ncbi:Rrf2 family transcriptional regulator [uncultured Roseobacter sp.]|uniref:RrF2 family transcriptional regulator n=1 Tax=uncultured Roseobacter sp. TaxID=114847 RepID=UPI002639D9AC|nr:Rrf2 family transcriptional regulator [uncultured Roseobacter sp.]